MIKQFVPSEFCLKCLGCCRFKEVNSVWSPCLLDEEGGRRICPVDNPNGADFVCPYLEVSDNKFKIYDLRPFECQLQPFLINLRKGKVLLTVDLNCPYVYEKINSQEAKDYIVYLTNYLNSPKQLKMLKSNLQIIQAYEEVREVAEINLKRSETV